MMTVATATPAWAQPEERDRLSAEIVSSMFAVMDLKAAIVKGVEASGDIESFAVRPEWTGMLKDAMIEEVEHDMPAIQAIFSRGFAEGYTVEELRAGAVMLRDPAVLAAFKAGAEGKTAPRTLRIGKDAQRAVDSKAGKSFFAKSDQIEVVFKNSEADLLGEIIPGTFRRFADKAEAAEVARRR